MKVQSLNNPICHLGEGPLWNVEKQQLFWTDILEGKIWKYTPSIQKVELAWQGDHKVGGFAFAKDGGMILCSDKGIFKIQKNQLGNVHAKPEKIVDIPLAANERFNDITTDPKGRLFAGTKCDDNKNGKLYLVEKGKKPIVVIDNTGISNGMTFSNDLKYFYHTDSIILRIMKYQYDVNTGRISNPELFYQGKEENGFPDGITIDTEDHIWVAFWSSSKVRRLNKKGEFVEEIKVPAIQPSSLIFGGAGMNELFITSACEGGFDIKNGLDQKGNFLGGLVFRVETKFKGRPEWPVDL
jgi:D-xylono/L-arabinono-1,4-lactonase